MAMFGWSKLDQAEVYTRQADKKRLASGATERIANAFAPNLDSECPNVVNNRDKSIG